MSIPKSVRTAVQQRLWALADELEWESLRQVDKARYYEIWTNHPAIGGVISRYMDNGRIRVYLKDTLLKNYGRDKLADPRRPLHALGVDENEKAIGEYNKPHGRRFEDGRVVCWGRADDWKTILMAIHERAYEKKGKPFAAVFLSSCGRFHDVHGRAVVEDAAKKLGIERVVWLE